VAVPLGRPLFICTIDVVSGGNCSTFSDRLALRVFFVPKKIVGTGYNPVWIAYDSCQKRHRSARFDHSANRWQRDGYSPSLAQCASLGISSDRLAYVNHLIDLAPDTSNSFSGQTFHRSSMNPGPGFPNYPDSVLIGLVDGTSTTIDLGPTAGVYQYLFARYDETNAGSEVWYVGSLSGIIDIPFGARMPFPTGRSLEARVLPPPVQDGGAAVMLLGPALGTARRFLRS
jgi:hypothetical protein